MVWVSVLLACGRVEPAPANVDGLSRWFLTGYERASDEEIDAAVANLWVAVDADTLGEAVDGALTDLTAEDVIELELPEGTDPTRAAGVYFARTLACPLADVQGIVTAVEQDELYVGVYDAYERHYTSDLAGWMAGDVDRLDWSVELDSKLLGASYHESLRGGARAVRDLPDDVAAHGPILMSRTHLAAPAAFEEGSSKSFDQDYQIEVYVEREPGVTVHLYAVWRELNMGGGLDQDNEDVMRIILNNLADWDDGTEEICAQGLP